MTGYAVSQGQVWRCAFWSFGFSILCYALLTVCANRNPQWRRSHLRLACRLWTSTSLGFFTGLIKETLDAIPGVPWPWCGPQNPTWENPCRFDGRVVLVYYESAVVAMIVLIAYSMGRAYLRECHYRLNGRHTPCDETVAESVDNDNDDDDLFDNNEARVHDNGNQKPNDVNGYARTENNSESSVADDSLQLHLNSKASCESSSSSSSSCCSSGEMTMVTVVSAAEAAVSLYSNDDTLGLDDGDEQDDHDAPSSVLASKADGDSLLVSAEEGLSSTGTTSSGSGSSSSNEIDSDTTAVAATTGEVDDTIDEDHDNQSLG
jgi:hypothetical protein